jgi:serine/threonine protein kinase
MPTDPIIVQPFPGEFHFCEPLGEGKFGKVWLAHDLRMGRLTAVKTIKPDSPERANRLSQLDREAGLLGGCLHPNIVTFFAWREAHGESYLFMQYVPGGSLRERLRREPAGKLSWAAAARYVADVAEGLAELHKRGVIHRDIKPENILWHAETDQVLLTDFGISARLSQGLPAGTPHFMSPEAFDGDISTASDVYSLAATLFVLLTGSFPFSGDSVDELRARIVRGLPRPDSRLIGVPDDVQHLLRAALSAVPESRPRLSTFIEQLRGALNRPLADTVAWSSSECSESKAGLEVRVSRRMPDGSFQPVIATQAVRQRRTRDMKAVPPEPDKAVLKNGDLVRVEAAAARSGHLFIINIGPGGNLNMLRPRSPQQSSAVEGSSAVHICDVEIVPPEGTERLIAVWSPQPLSRDQLADLLEPVGQSTSGPHRATRDMKALDSSFREDTECEVAVLELEHGE